MYLLVSNNKYVFLNFFQVEPVPPKVPPRSFAGKSSIMAANNNKNNNNNNNVSVSSASTASSPPTESSCSSSTGMAKSTSSGTLPSPMQQSITRYRHLSKMLIVNCSKAITFQYRGLSNITYRIRVYKTPAAYKKIKGLGWWHIEMWLKFFQFLLKKAPKTGLLGKKVAVYLNFN